jgi:hypothetical protein
MKIMEELFLNDGLDNFLGRDSRRTDIVNHNLPSLRHRLSFQGISWAVVRQDTHSRMAKVLGVVRMKVLPAFIRLMTRETTESLSKWAPKSLSAISMISEMCIGRPAFLSTCSTTSTIDVRLVGCSCNPFWKRSIVLSLDSATSF